jgi:hypothetical protein
MTELTGTDERQPLRLVEEDWHCQNGILQKKILILKEKIEK